MIHLDAIPFATICQLGIFSQLHDY